VRAHRNGSIIGISYHGAYQYINGVSVNVAAASRGAAMKAYDIHGMARSVA